jgi:hypothetical protein
LRIAESISRIHGRGAATQGFPPSSAFYAHLIVFFLQPCPSIIINQTAVVDITLFSGRHLLQNTNWMAY